MASSSSSSLTFPPILPTATLPLAFRLPSEPVLLIGGGAVAAGRLSSLLAAGAIVTLISPRSELNSEVEYRIFSDEEVQNRIVYKDKLYESEEDLWWYSEGGGEKKRFKMVLTAIDDPVVSKEIGDSCRRIGLMVNVADVPPLCDFYFGALIRRGPLQVLISTGGAGPRLAHRIKALIEGSLPRDNVLEDAITNIGELRKGLRKIENGGEKEVIDRRMKWMVGVSDGWSFEELAKMDEGMRNKVLEGWEKGEVKSFEEVSGNWSWFSGVRCPVKEGGKGKASKCPFLIASSGFVAGLSIATLVAIALVKVQGRR